MAVKYETDLYSPIKAYFEQRGFVVKAEVRHCDLVGIRSDLDEPLIVEMKKTFNLSLLLQGMQRLKLSPIVYLAVERNRNKRGAVNQRWGELTALCSQLGLGLMTVTFYKTKAPLIDVLCEPARRPEGSTPGAAPSSSRKGGIRRQRLMREFDGRSGDFNVGGSTGKPLVTAYREKALRVASSLRAEGEASPATLAQLANVASAASILQKNYYGWFERIRRGKYGLTIKGIQALTEHAFMLEPLSSPDSESSLSDRDAVELLFEQEGQNDGEKLERIAELVQTYIPRP